jgi:ornithine cyclodeaminase/alanine dehydrogenase-like protein (mu-crystallin family)
MITPPYIDAAMLASLVPMASAIEAIERALLDGWPGRDPLRTPVPVSSGELLLMPSEAPGHVGIKVTTVAPDNPGRGLPRIQGTYVLHDAESLTPLALLDGTALTALRTPALSAVATRHLASPDAAELIVVGTGPQAVGHVHAMREVRGIRRAGVVGRTEQAAHDLVRRLDDLGIEAYAAGPPDIAGADVVCMCTTARSPVFPGEWFGARPHINAVGSHQPDARELDAATIARGQVVVESRDAALAEAGDLLMAFAEGVSPEVIRADLAELVHGAPIDRQQMTIFKSVGLAWQDLAVATEAYRRLTG